MKQNLIINPVTGAPFVEAPQPAWISEEGDESVRTLVMVQGGEIICILAVVRLTENGAGEYKLPHTGEHGTEADLDAAMKKVQQIIIDKSERRN